MPGHAAGNQFRQKQCTENRCRNQVEPFDQPPGEIAPGQQYQREPARDIGHQAHTQDDPHNLLMNYRNIHFFIPSTVVAANMEASTMYELPGMIKDRMTATTPAIIAVIT